VLCLDVIYIRSFIVLSVVSLASAAWLGPVMIVCALGFGLIVGLLKQAKAEDLIIEREEELDRRQDDLEDIARYLAGVAESEGRRFQVFQPKLDR